MPQKSTSRSGLNMRHIELTKKQHEFFKIMSDPKTKVVFLSGPAGSSKSFLSIYTALSLWSDGDCSDILYLRTVVESAERSLGYLKGGEDEKFSPYLAPLEEKVDEMLQAPDKQRLKRSNALLGSPVNFIRGQDWKQRVVIADEMQNATMKELITVLTRMNKGTRLFICGDAFQSDIKNSGFSQLCKLFDSEESKENGVYHLAFDKEDIQRDEVISFLLDQIEEII